jgi:hypothetical protein
MARCLIVCLQMLITHCTLKLTLGVEVVILNHSLVYVNVSIWMNFSKIKLINAQEKLLIISGLLSLVNVAPVYLFICIHGPLLIHSHYYRYKYILQFLISSSNP